jgi:hypothetical protein
MDASKIVKICILGLNNQITKVLIFAEEIELNTLFSNLELEKINNDGAQIIFSTQKIHIDDSIRVVKNKILKELSDISISYKELYLFSATTRELPTLNIYKSITKNEDELFTKQKFNQFAKNVDVSNIETNNEFYEYEDLLGISGLHNVLIPFGQKFEKDNDYLFVVNPFQLESTDVITTNSLFSFENSLFFNYGSLYNNTIYVCSAYDVFEYASQNNIDNRLVSQMYFPFLFKENITDVSTLANKKQYLLEETMSNITDDTWKLYETVDMFYDIYNLKKPETEFPYFDTGIQSFNITIKTEYVNLLPLDAIFKNIHATKEIPFIKYNPGFRRENMYRLYSEKISKTGKKIPYLQASEILKLSKEIGKSGDISLFIKSNYQGSPMTLYIHFKRDGNVQVQSSLITPITEKILNEILLQALNPIIDNINGFLEKTGYSIRKFNTLYDNYIIINNINYTTSINITKKMDLNKYKSCISSIFAIESTDILSPNGAKMRFKRVENYEEMDLIDEFITIEKNKLTEIGDIIRLLMNEFDIDEKMAQERVIQFFTKHNIFNGKILANSGFPVSIKLFSMENKVKFEVSNITAIEYIEVLSIYFDSILRIYQAPDTTNISISRIEATCKKNINYNNVDKTNIENIVAPVIVNIPFLPEQEFDSDFFMNKTTEVIPDSIQNDSSESGEPLFMDADIQDFSEEDKGISLESGEPLFMDADIQDFSEEEDKKEDKKDKSISLESDDDFFGMDADEYDEENEENSKKEGGAPNEDELEINVEGKKLKNPNPFQNRIEQRDPKLILKTEVGEYNRYSKVCPPAVLRQPVILNNTEKENIDKNHEGSYTTAIQYGSDSNNPYWYICPRYWSLKSNVSLTQEEVDEILKTNPNAIIPNKASVVPKGAFIYEFKAPKEHLNEKGEYIPHYPGLQKDSHPDGYSIPCCFKRQQTNQEERISRISNYVVDSNKYPVQKNRWGFLPNAAQTFFKIDNRKCVSKTNPSIIKPNSPCLLRYGVEQNINQSFVGCIADIYAYDNDKTETPSISEMCNIIHNSITLDMFIKYNNGSLVSVFKPKDYEKIDNTNLEKYAEYSDFAQIILENEPQSKYEISFLKETIASYENFLSFLIDGKSYIDHTYIWDILFQPNAKLLKNGINIIILNIPNEPDSIELLCPTNYYSLNKYDSKKGTLILLKQDDFYEPVYLFENKDSKQYATKLFYKKTTKRNAIIEQVLSIVENITDKYCKPKSSLPRLYKFKRNKNATEIIEIIKQYKDENITISKQIINYNSKLIGFIVNMEEGTIFIPCSPSSIMENIDIEFFDSNDIWFDYDTTVELLLTFNEKTNGNINCIPSQKVVEYDKITDKNIIIGIITDTNQFIKINPTVELDKINDDGLDIIYGSDYIEADKHITTRENQDEERINMIRNIDLETQFYSVFRSTIRILLSQYENRKSKLDIISTLNSDFYSYKEKIDKIYLILKNISKDSFIFQDIEEERIAILKEVSNCYSNCRDKPYCISNTDGSCRINIPKMNLIMQNDNEKLYYIRLSDELIRFSRIRSFMLEPQFYLNLTNMEYKIKDNEILLLDSFMKPEYFAELKTFNTDNYVQNITYDIAIPDPSISQNYSNKTELN